MGASLGKFLQGCREQADLSAEVMAKALKVSVTQVQALEADRFDLFDDEAALKQALNDYAEMVDLSPGAVERLYQRQKQQAAKGTIFSATVEPVAAPPSGAKPGRIELDIGRKPVSRRRSFPWAFLFVLPIIVAVAYVIWQQANMNVSTTSVPNATQPAAAVQSHPVIPLGGGVVRLTAAEATRFQLTVDRRDLRKYRIDANGSLSWEVTASARFTFEHPERVQLFINEQPLPSALDTEVHLIPQTSGAGS